MVASTGQPKLPLYLPGWGKIADGSGLITVAGKTWGVRVGGQEVCTGIIVRLSFSFSERKKFSFSSRIPTIQLGAICPCDKEENGHVVAG